ncbi:MAG: ABC transporter ATP-binding protein [Dongiaceae bacterium]
MAAGRSGDGGADRPVVRLEAVRKRFGAVTAVAEVSLEIQRGEFLTLLGPSGCGKTTTLRLISGLEVPDDGLVWLEDRVVNDVPPFRRDVNTVFQSYALFPHLSVFDNVAYGLTLKRLPRPELRARVSAMLERVGLSDKARRLPRELSGGQMQRVALARALVNEPRVLLLDEPLGALDARLRQAMQLELRRLHLDLGLTFVCVTHDQEEALVMSNRIAVMQDGRIAQLGTPREIFERPASRFVADFIGGCNFLPARHEGGGRLLLPGGVAWRVDPARIPALVPGSGGGALVAAIRPQRVELRPPGDAGPLSAAATLRDIVYAGAAQRLHLTLAPGTELVAELPGRAAAGLAPGAAVTIGVAPEDLLLFPDGGAGA